MTLSVNASSEEAQRTAGHDRFGWGRFLDFTRFEATNLAQRWTSWTSVPANKKRATLQRINERLEGEDIPDIQDDVLTWRMSPAMRRLRGSCS
ncbi:hypothetical protein K469DRAFT_551890 [Zopfia rhizophila CBS 207.26]|uniref:Uncharacterized protein n=1 Tax=Zopfia rhizophila CBS 207.26 TaxID=1314779 RepID=A0A6A6EQI8_9PEZI|nr:hypothetical protein K469DRAFT_551890 [Zopfia rhizophila CBS 207.26]